MRDSSETFVTIKKLIQKKDSTLSHSSSHNSKKNKIDESRSVILYIVQFNKRF